MIFTTFAFAVFFLILYPLLFVVGRSWRNPLLLAASYLFYMSAIPWYITVVLAITLIDFAAGIGIERARSRERKGFLLCLSVASNLGLLFAFKYADFASSTLNALGVSDLPMLRLVLPIGLSFHTFQALSYTIEVYRGNYPAERNLVRYALYVAFFPQMVAGPIERPYNLLPQFHLDPMPTADDVLGGLRTAIWGVFKKVVVADLLASLVQTVYAAPRQFTGPVLLLATVFFAIQIYCDFSGYSDIAVGIARMMAYRLTINFRQPYLARSIADFWRRWHISLTSWFRDYVYLPLGGNRVSPHRHLANVLVVFLLSGLWHGGHWTFVIWGVIHGVYYIVGRLTAQSRARLLAMIGVSPSSPVLAVGQTLVTFGLVLVAWVFFRAASVHDGVHIVTHLLDWRGFTPADLLGIGLPRFELALAFVLIAVVLLVDWLIETKPPPVLHLWSSRWVRWLCYDTCVFAIICFGVFGGVEFIYFQF